MLFRSAAVRKAGLYRPCSLHCVFCGDPRFEIGVPEFLKKSKASPFGRGGIACDDGEGKPVAREPLYSDKLSLCQSEAIAVSVFSVSALALSVSLRSTAPLSRGASGEEVKLYGMPKPPLVRSNNDDRRQWRKQGVVVGDRKSTRLNSSHQPQSRMPSSA